MDLQEKTFKGNPIRVIDGEFIVVVDVMRILGSQDPAKDVASTIVYNLDHFSPHLKITQLGGSWFQLLSFAGTIRLVELVPSPESFTLRDWFQHIEAGTEYQPTQREKELEEEMMRLRKMLSPDERLTPEQKGKLREHVSRRLISLKTDGYESASYQSIYAALNHKFGVATYTEILSKDFGKAMAFITWFKPRQTRRSDVDQDDVA